MRCRVHLDNFNFDVAFNNSNFVVRRQLGENVIVEVNGIKMEVDERTATVSKIESYKVGDPVKLLYKSYSSYEVKYAVIIGFDQFKKRPAISLAYIDASQLKYVQIYEGSEHELSPVQEHDLVMEKTWILDRMKDQITRKEQELNEEKSKREHFIKFFGKYFEKGLPDSTALEA